MTTMMETAEQAPAEREMTVEEVRAALARVRADMDDARAQVAPLAERIAQAAWRGDFAAQDAAEREQDALQRRLAKRQGTVEALVAQLEFAEARAEEDAEERAYPAARMLQESERAVVVQRLREALAVAQDARFDRDGMAWVAAVVERVEGLVGYVQGGALPGRLGGTLGDVRRAVDGRQNLSLDRVRRARARRLAAADTLVARRRALGVDRDTATATATGTATEAEGEGERTAEGHRILRMGRRPDDERGHRVERV